MKLTLTATNKLQMINGQQCRIWTGETDQGVPVHAYIRTLSPQTNHPETLAAFEKELISLPKPSRELVSFDLRFAV